MFTGRSLRILLLTTPLVLIGLAATGWLWMEYGMSVYFDAATGALAGCM